MMKVKCWDKNCNHNKEGFCSLTEISLVTDGEYNFAICDFQIRGAISE